MFNDKRILGIHLNNIVRSNECLGWKAKNISHSKLSYGDAFLIQNKES